MKRFLSILILSVVFLSGCSDKKSDKTDQPTPEMPKDNKPVVPPPPPPPPKDK